MGLMEIFTVATKRSVFISHVCINAINRLLTSNFHDLTELYLIPCLAKTKHENKGKSEAVWHVAKPVSNRLCKLNLEVYEHEICTEDHTGLDWL